MSTSCDTLIVGAGIVGTAVARLLGRGSVHVLDAGGPDLAGATGHSPGYISELGQHPVLTALAAETTSLCERLVDAESHVFDRVGSIEVVTTESGADLQLARRALATDSGTAFRCLDPREAEALAPQCVDSRTALGALYFPDDAVTDVPRLTAILRTQAEASGARFYWSTRVLRITEQVGHVVVDTSSETFTAARVVLATSVWARVLTDPLGVRVPVVPIRHPFAYGPTGHAAPRRQPFVRFPEHSMYARWHSDRWGFGTRAHSDHLPDMTGRERADLPWDGTFEETMCRLSHRFKQQWLFQPTQWLDGVIPTTPDGLPIVGPLTGNVWIAAGALVTHALAGARVLTDLMNGCADVPAEVIRALAPARFADLDEDAATALAIDAYHGRVAIRRSRHA
jgi:glycine/D-amino acid oxidase-like deaminating enzyme